jgi:hypothetical protein
MYVDWSGAHCSSDGASGRGGAVRSGALSGPASDEGALGEMYSYIDIYIYSLIHTYIHT